MTGISAMLKKGWKAINALLSPLHIAVIRSMAYSKEFSRSIVTDPDYVRLQCLRLCGREISQHSVPGSAAEVGVYKGNFAVHIHDVFPDRVLYLFDTFEGFDGRDLAAEHHRMPASGRFADTSAEAVLRRMKHPELCVVRKGYFPESADGLNDVFAFVSIDVDLYLPTKNALEYFYPRLSRGGFLFIHDYHNDEFAGVSRAVQEFAAAEHIAFVPVPDIAGTVIIAKP